jgi:hypothetical protein
MPLDLHPSCKNRLTSFLAEKIRSLKVEHRRFLNYEDASGLNDADKILPAAGDVREKLNAFLDDNPFYEFVTDQITRTLNDTENWATAKTLEGLTSCSAFTDAEATAKHLTESFNSLPWQYALTFEMPETLAVELSSLVGQFSFADDVKLVLANEEFQEQHPLPKQAGALSGLLMIFTGCR